MATETLSGVIVDVLHNNAKTGKLLVGAYRTGAHRAVGTFRKGIGTVVDKTADRLNAARRTRMLQLSHRLTQSADTRVKQVADGASKVLDKFYKGAAETLGKLSARVDKVDNRYASKYVKLASNMTLPTAKLVRAVTRKIAAGTEKVSARIAGEKPAVRPARKPRRAKRASKAS